ncbi:LysR family transcriptional regulator [Novosphingobium sp. SG707]|uniref:LysR family transcriptional regulator n=1 Tax=Novosphingobium sp. SG707 TaxID=2586996 RepID=UPI00144706C2|nr:LysR family transcriptional regulator [Novosphingobium sp. SG707]NKJ00580.1 DNA-binding transcriptional LysR family regulator [Novosphingobium sp. SG707]
MNRIALYHLETLLWIARLGTFAAAAERLNTTQPTISARVRELEAQIGYPLFRREGRRMLLTVRGRQLVRDTEPLWAALERTLAADNLAGARGVVRIGTGEIAAASCLPGFVAEIEHDMPAVTLDITISLTAQLLQDLLGATSDLVFLAGPVASPGLQTASIGGVALQWLASPTTATAMREGATPPLWSLPRQSPLHQVMLETLSGDALPAIRTCNNARMLIDIIAAGQGMALLPETMTREAVADGRLQEVWPRPKRGIEFQAAIRAEESDPLVLELFRRAAGLRIDPR